MIKSFGGFLKAVRDASSEAPETHRVARQVLEKEYASRYVSSPVKTKQASMSTVAGSRGGYLLPQEYSAKLLKVLAADSIILPRSEVVDVGAEQARVPILDVTRVAPAGINTALVGGISLSWGFSQLPPQTAEPVFKQLDLHMWDLLGWCLLSNQFWADSTPAHDRLMDIFARAGSWFAEAAFLRGTGAGDSMPLGILTSPGLLRVTRGVPGTIQDTDISGMVSHMLPWSWRHGRVCWIVSPSAWSQIGKLSHFVVNEEEESSVGQVGSLFSRPVFCSDVGSPLGSLGDILLCDCSCYVIGLRRDIAVDVSSDGPGFRTNQTDFRLHMRCDGKPLNDDVITLPNGETVSPFVGLD